MDIERLTYRLPFNGFDIIFLIDTSSSIEGCKYPPPNMDDYFYAEADIWLENEKGCFLVTPSSDMGNFFEDLRDLIKYCKNPPNTDTSKAYFESGKWYECIAGYWRRFLNDTQTADDEEIYDVVTKYAQFCSNHGNIACYEYDGEYIIEVASKEIKNWDNFIHHHSSFIPEKLSEYLESIRSDILKYLLPHKQIFIKEKNMPE
ncbi:hypothetical protein [Leeia sp.]|uniref:hypothetical protein n=1 Tax=Leeia sp. TaxID=2884678 RepID=UPI0035B2FC47